MFANYSKDDVVLHSIKLIVHFLQNIYVQRAITISNLARGSHLSICFKFQMSKLFKRNCSRLYCESWFQQSISTVFHSRILITINTGCSEYSSPWFHDLLAIPRSIAFDSIAAAPFANSNTVVCSVTFNVQIIIVLVFIAHVLIVHFLRTRRDSSKLFVSFLRIVRRVVLICG